MSLYIYIYEPIYICEPICFTTNCSTIHPNPLYIYLANARSSEIAHIPPQRPYQRGRRSTPMPILFRPLPLLPPQRVQPLSFYCILSNLLTPLACSLCYPLLAFFVLPFSNTSSQAHFFSFISLSTTPIVHAHTGRNRFPPACLLFLSLRTVRPCPILIPRLMQTCVLFWQALPRPR